MLFNVRFLFFFCGPWPSINFIDLNSHLIALQFARVSLSIIAFSLDLIYPSHKYTLDGTQPIINHLCTGVYLLVCGWLDSLLIGYVSGTQITCTARNKPNVVINLVVFILRNVKWYTVFIYN